MPCKPVIDEVSIFGGTPKMIEMTSESARGLVRHRGHGRFDGKPMATYSRTGR